MNQKSSLEVSGAVCRCHFDFRNFMRMCRFAKYQNRQAEQSESLDCHNEQAQTVANFNLVQLSRDTLDSRPLQNTIEPETLQTNHFVIA